MTILFKALLIVQTDGIANSISRFKWHLDALYFVRCSQLIDCCRFRAIKLNGLIKCNNYNYLVPRSQHITVELHINSLQFGVYNQCCIESDLFFFYLKIQLPIRVCVCVYIYIYIYVSRLFLYRHLKLL